LQQISNDELDVHTKNPYYWIAHYVFDDKEGITAESIKKKVNKMYAAFGEAQLEIDTGDDNKSSTEESEQDDSSLNKDEESAQDDEEESPEIKRKKPETKRITRSNYY